MGVSEVYRNAFVWDDHGGFELQPDTPLDPVLSPWREAGVGYLSVNVSYDPQPWFQAIQNIAALRRRLPLEVPYCRMVSSVTEIDQAREEGKIALTFDIEGMNALAGQIDMVALYYDLGVRQMVIAYNRNNMAGSGCHDDDTGLTDFGRRAVDEMNRVGMVVDCSHTGFKTTMAAMERSADPVIFSHSNPKSLVDHDRNITDAQIRACAETGGVIGINGVNLFLGDAVANPAAVARHAAYVAELTASHHVGLSLDYGPDLDSGTDAACNDAVLELFASSPEYWPEKAGYDGTVGCLDIRRLPDVAKELARVGFDKTEITGILGANFRRVAEQVWK